MEDVGRLLEEQQTGQYIPTKEEDNQREALIKNGASAPRIPQPGPIFNQMRMPRGNMTARSTDVSREAAEADWGESKYDVGEFVPGEDLENRRALEQSYFSKIGTGLMKGGVTAAATAVNTTLGTVFGIGSAIYELAADADGDGRSFMDTIDAGSNNWLSAQMTKLQNWSEKQFPNYRTTEERTDKYQREWWKHMGSANFIGDSILKNFGFTVGAMAGGMAWTKLIGAGMTKALANNVMRGAIAASEGDAEASAALMRAAEAIKRGTAVGADYETVIKNSKQAALALNRMNAQLQLYGSVIGAMGEGTTEGLMAKQEFFDDYMNSLNEKFIADNQNLEKNLANKLKDTDMVREILNADGTKSYELNDKGLVRLQEEKNELAKKYMEDREKAEREGERLASTTFLLNLPILTTSNAIQFGRMFSGGWSTARNTVSGLNGGIHINPAAEGKLPTIAADYASKYGKGAVTGKTILNSLKVAGSESFEEMAQGAVSSGAKQVANNNLSSFNDAGYDAKATNEVARWFEGMYKGGSEYLGDFKNWQEGALGALTGLFGIPGKRWNGGIAQARRDAKEEVGASIKAANDLNNLVNSKDFQDRWHGYIRHLKYDNDMKDAVGKDNEYAWHNAESAQLISDVIMFADAGKLDDLNTVISTYGTVANSDAGSIREAVKLGNGEEGWTKNLSDAEVVEKVKKQTERIQNTIKEYNDTYDALAARAPMGTSPEFLKELVFTAQQVKDFDRRFMEMFGETMTAIEPILRVMASVGSEGEVLNHEEVEKRFQNVRDDYERLFAGSLIPIKMPAIMQKEIDKSLDLLEEMTEGDDELHKKVVDMRRLTNDRKEFYGKLQTLQSSKAQEKFNETAVTPAKVEEAAEKAISTLETQNLNTLEDVKREYFSRDAKGRADFISSLEGVEESNPNAKTFLQVKRKFDEFQNYIKNNPITSPDITVTPPMIQSAINDLLRRARNVNELINLPDNVFLPQDQFNLNFQSPFGPVSPTAYASVKQALRASMAAFAGISTATASKEAISPAPVTPTPVGPVSTPVGYDAAAPASMEPAPVSSSGEAAAKAPVEEKPEPQIEEKPLPVGNPPTLDSLAIDDQIVMEYEPEDAQKSEDDKTARSGEKDKTAYYRTSVPEVDTGEAKKARSALMTADREKLQSADLSDFVIKHPEYADVWNALQQRGAFGFVSTELNYGDEIEFVVDPTFPTYNGQYQILMTTVRDGKRQVLTVLSGQNSKYFGLSELRQAIDDEYSKFRESNPNDLFIFSKKSNVFARRSGLIDYDFSRTEEKGIKNIPSYSEDAPTIFINRNGEAVGVRGTFEPDTVPPRYTDPLFNRGDITGDDRRGNLYYLAKSGDGHYIPIRLNVEHFKSDNKDADNPIFRSIRSIIDSISAIAHNTNSSNLAEQNEKLHNEVKNLLEYLDIHDVFFELGEYENVGIALRVNNGTDSQIRRPDQITNGKWLTDLLAGYGYSIQIRLDENGKMPNLGIYVDNDLITSNARMLRAKGVDFYINPYNPETGKFEPLTENVKEANAELDEMRKETREEKESKPVLLDEEFGDRDDYEDFDSVPDEPFDRYEEVAEAEETEKEAIFGDAEDDPVLKELSKEYKDLTPESKAHLSAKKWTEKEWDEASKPMREKALRC